MCIFTPIISWLNVDAMVKIAVLGAGINGLTAAVRIKEKYKEFDVVIISKDFTPNTTADGSGGLWHPYLCGTTPQRLLSRWGSETYRFLHSIWREEGCNISMMPMHNLKRKGVECTKPDWANDVFEFRMLGPEDLRDLSRLYSVNYVGGYTFMSFVVHSASMLSYLQRRFLQNGGRLMTATVKTLEDSILEEYDVIVNCTGLGARDIVPDNRVFPIRGQIHKVKAPWLNTSIIDDDADVYIIPNAFNCVLGGTHQEHDFNTKVDLKDMNAIMNGCQQLIPALKNVEILENWVGLRPGRDEVRLEPETRRGKLYIHNYGHGGSGLTLFWGCGSDLLNILDQHLKETGKINAKL